MDVHSRSRNGRSFYRLVLEITGENEEVKTHNIIEAMHHAQGKDCHISMHQEDSTYTLSGEHKKNVASVQSYLEQDGVSVTVVKPVTKIMINDY